MAITQIKKKYGSKNAFSIYCTSCPFTLQAVIEAKSVFHSDLFKNLQYNNEYFCATNLLSFRHNFKFSVLTTRIIAETVVSLNVLL
jgi:hypothetical protein